MNKDYQNSRCHLENAGTLSDLGSSSPYDAEDVDEMLWPDMANNVRAVQIGKASPFELSEAGLRKHRRQAAIEYLEDRLRENPEEIDQWIRRPLDPNPFFDRRMPALMRGADSRPWHLTRRQWEILRLWVRRLQQKTLKPLVAKKPRTTGRSRRHA
jgi:hypothetical protein